MDMNQYQTEARKTAIYPDIGHNFTYPTLGLCGESGEVAEKIKKILRDKGGVVDESDRAELARELGDVLWYIANLAAELELTLDFIALSNMNKLRLRQLNDKLHGSGDNR